MRHSRALPAKARRRESQGEFGARRVGVGMAWPQTGWRGRPARRRLPRPVPIAAPRFPPRRPLLRLLRGSVAAFLCGCASRAEASSSRACDVPRVSLDSQVSPPPLRRLERGAAPPGTWPPRAVLGDLLPRAGHRGVLRGLPHPVVLLLSMTTPRPWTRGDGVQNGHGLGLSYRSPRPSRAVPVHLPGGASRWARQGDRWASPSPGSVAPLPRSPRLPHQPHNSTSSGRGQCIQL